MSLQAIIVTVLTLIAVFIGVIYPIIKWRDWRGVTIHLAWILMWYGFYFIWGPWKWRTAAFGTPEWMWDNYGHILGGFLGTFHCIYELRYFFPTLFLMKGQRGIIIRRLMLYAAVPIVVFVVALLWELSEMAHDFQEYAIQAQKGGADTTIDIALAMIFCCLALLVHSHFFSFYRKLSLDSNKIEELEERADALRIERNDLITEIRELKRSQLKELTPALIKKLKEKMHPSSDEDDTL